MQKLTINLRERSYPILIEHGILSQLGELVKAQIPTATRSFVISNPTVDALYGERAMKSLEAVGLNPMKGLIPDGEEYKSIDEAMKLYDQLILHEMDRSSVIISLGGGVVGDLAGFVAATYMRGMPFVQVPTSLLAQVDSSVGGKVAVNHPAGKNLIGTFHQPRLVVVDTATLETLPNEEMVAGLGEVIKHGMIQNANYFDWVEANLERISNKEPYALEQLVFGSCTIKGKIVEADEYERNLRAVLNFGHTVGHALEVLTQYKRYRHGEAVAIGMVVASRLSERLKMFTSTNVARLISVLERAGLPTKLPKDIEPAAIMQAIHHDKKSFQGKIKLVLPNAIGGVQITDQWDEEDLMKVLEEGVSQK